MEEARHSINVRFNYMGYDSQVTLRDDTEDCGALVERFIQVVAYMETKGARPARRWEEVKGNGNGNGVSNGKTDCGSIKTEQPASAQPRLENDLPPTCNYCGSSEHMELIEFVKNGGSRKAWKCKTCEKWHYDKKK